MTDETPDEAAARRRFTQPMNPDPVSALARHPAPPDAGHALTNDCIGGGCEDCETEPPEGIEP